MKKKILVGVAVLVIYGIAASFFAHTKADDQQIVLALIMAGGLAIINFFLGILYNQRALRERTDLVTMVVMKNMLKRMAIILTILFTIVLSIDLNHFVFVASFFILYFLFQIIEINDLHKKQLRNSP